MRVLFVAPNWLGDIVMALPALAAVHRSFASDTLAVAAPAELAEVFTAVPGVQEIVPVRRAGTRRVSDDAARIADGRFDVAILCPNSFRSAWMVRRAGVSERWGYRTDFRGWLLTRAVRKPRRRRGERVHHAQYYTDLLRGLAIDPGSFEARLVVPDDARARATALFDLNHVPSDALRIGLAPGAAYGHAKRWPPGRFAEIIDRLAHELGATSVLLGSAGDRDAGLAIESALATRPASAFGSRGSEARVVNLIGRTDIQTLIGVMSQCCGFLSNDTGAMHLAAATGIPVTAIFGPTDERVTAPLGRHTVLTNPVFCRPCLLHDCPIDHRCMSGISTDAVFEAVARNVRDAGTEVPA